MARLGRAQPFPPKGLKLQRTVTTTVVKTIGAGGDYTTLQAWINACPADLTIANQIWQGQIKASTDSFSSATQLLNISGITTDATRYVELTTAPGASFRDNANVRTNALKFNASNGCAITLTGGSTYAIACSVNYTRFSKLQVSATASGCGAINVTGTNTTIDYSIFEGWGPVVQVAANATLRNLLIVGHEAGATTYPLSIQGVTNAVNCTILKPVDVTQSVSAVDIAAAVTGNTFTNCCMYRASTSAVNLGAGASSTYTTCASNLSSQPTGFLVIGTYSGQFKNNSEATEDFRLVSTSGLIDVGTTDATNAGNDISGRARPSANSYDIGCWESTERVIAAASGTYTITGNAASLVRKYVIPAISGTYVLTGNDAALLRKYVLPAVSGIYTLTGNAATLTYSPTQQYVLLANSGSYTLTGNAASLIRKFVLSAVSGVYTLTGNAATVAFNRKLVAASGTYTLTGNAAVFPRTYVLGASFGSYSITGNTASLIYSGATGSTVVFYRGISEAPSEAGISKNHYIFTDVGGGTYSVTITPAISQDKANSPNYEGYKITPP